MNIEQKLQSVLLEEARYQVLHAKDGVNREKPKQIAKDVPANKIIDFIISRTPKSNIVNIGADVLPDEDEWGKKQPSWETIVIWKQAPSLKEMGYPLYLHVYEDGNIDRIDMSGKSNPITIDAIRKIL